jgi:hypothetical protein
MSAAGSVVWLGFWEDAQHTNLQFRAFSTRAGAEQWRREIVVERWEKDGYGPLPEDIKQAVEQFFDAPDLFDIVRLVVDGAAVNRLDPVSEPGPGLKDEADRRTCFYR